MVNTNRLILIVMTCLIYLASSTVLASPAIATDPDFAAIDAFVEVQMRDQRLPGLALGIVKGDQIVHLKGFGIADPSGRAVTPQTPFIIGSLSKSFTALAVMQLVEEGKIELDTPVQHYLPWFRVADEVASAQITVRHLLCQTSGLSTKTGRSFQGSGDTSDDALEGSVRKLSAAELTGPVGAAHQYSTVNYAVLGLIVQAVSGQSYESYIQEHIFDLLEMQNSFTSQAEAQSQGFAAGYHYAFDMPIAVDLPYNRGLLPAGYLISSAEDMTHYLIAQLNDGRYKDTALVSSAGMLEMHHPAVPTGVTDTFYGMGWFVGPINGISAIHHQGETFNFHANMILLPDSQMGIVVLINGENSMDLLFGAARIADISKGVASLLAGQQPPSPPTNTSIWVVYGMLIGLIILQVGGVIRSVRRLQSGHLTESRVRVDRQIVLPLILNLFWALITLIVLPKILFGLPLMILATGLPDLGYTLLVSGLIALGWGILRTVLVYSASRASSKADSALMISESATRTNK
jgi:CubicO group peptidase (beta-lactamase class C family)